MLKNISCPSCSNNIQLNASFIYNGMPILCSNCHYSWFYTITSNVSKYKDLRQTVKANQISNKNSSKDSYSNNSYLNYLGRGVNSQYLNPKEISQPLFNNIYQKNTINPTSVNYYKDIYKPSSTYKNNFTEFSSSKSSNYNINTNSLNTPFVSTYNSPSSYQNVTHPSQSNYTPSQSNYTPSQSNYTPSQSNYTPSQSNYTPSQSNYTPSQSNYTPSQSNYTPSQSNSIKNKTNSSVSSKNTSQSNKKEIYPKIKSSSAEELKLQLQEKYQKKTSVSKEKPNFIHPNSSNITSNHHQYLKDNKLSSKEIISSKNNQTKNSSENSIITNILQDINSDSFNKSNTLSNPKHNSKSSSIKNEIKDTVSHTAYLENLISEIKNQSPLPQESLVSKITPSSEDPLPTFTPTPNIHKLKQDALLDEYLDEENLAISKKHISKNKSADLTSIVNKISKFNLKSQKDTPPQTPYTHSIPISNSKEDSNPPQLNADTIKNSNSNTSIKHNLNKLFNSQGEDNEINSTNVELQEQEQQNYEILTKEDLQKKYQKKNLPEFSKITNPENPQKIVQPFPVQEIYSHKKLRSEKETLDDKITRREKVNNLKQLTKKLIQSNDINSWVNYFTKEEPISPPKSNYMNNVSQEIHSNSPLSSKLNLDLSQPSLKQASIQNLSSVNEPEITLTSNLVFNQDEDNSSTSQSSANLKFPSSSKFTNSKPTNPNSLKKLINTISSPFNLFSKKIPNPIHNLNLNSNFAFSSINSTFTSNSSSPNIHKIQPNYSSNSLQNFFSNKSLVLKFSTYGILIILCSILIYYAGFLQTKNKDNTPQKIQISQATAKYLQSLSLNSEIDDSEIEIGKSFSSLTETTNQPKVTASIKESNPAKRNSVSLKNDPLTDTNNSIKQEISSSHTPNTQASKSNFFDKVQGKINNAILSLSNTKSNFLSNVRVINTISLWINKPFKSFETNIYIANSSSHSVTVTEVSLTIVNLQGTIVAQKIIPINQIINSRSSVNAILRLTDVPFNSYKVFATIKSYKEM